MYLCSYYLRLRAPVPVFHMGRFKILYFRYGPWGRITFAVVHCLLLRFGYFEFVFVRYGYECACMGRKWTVPGCNFPFAAYPHAFPANCNVGYWAGGQSFISRWHHAGFG